MSEPLPTLDYVRPAADRPVVCIPLARLVALLSSIPPVIGLAILAGFYVTRVDGFQMLGLFWLLIGGAITAITALIAVVGLAGSYSRSGDVKRARRLFSYGIAMGLVSIAVAGGFCASTGSKISALSRFQVGVENRTTQTVDVAFKFQGGDVVVGPIAPGQTVLSAVVDRKHAGSLDMDVRVGANVNRVQAANYLDADDLNGTESFTIEPDELP